MFNILNFFKKSSNNLINLSKRSSKFKLFYESVFGNRKNNWRDGPDIESLLCLNGYEKNLAEKILIDNLKNKDPFIFECVGVLKSKKSTKYLKSIFPNCHVSIIPSCGLALWRIHKDERVIGIIGMLLNHTDEFRKIDAIIALGQINDQKAKFLLCRALTDKSYLARYNALRYLSGLEGTLDKFHQIAQITCDASFNSGDSYHDDVSALLKSVSTIPNKYLFYHGNHINFAGTVWKVKHDIIGITLCDNKILIIFDYMQYPTNEVAHNLEAYSLQEELIWLGENPEVGPTDAYTNFYRNNFSDKSIDVGNFAGYKCTINIFDGKLIKSEFTK